MPNAHDTPLSERQQWPKLSEMPFADRARPDTCMRCAVTVTDDPNGMAATRTRWIEHDEWDRPTRALVVLCKACADREIAPHPRLYTPVPRYKPIPGAMELCAWCAHRQALRCMHPRAKANGGEGVAVTVARPSIAFMDGVRGGRRTGWREQIWPSAPKACDGRDEASPDA